MKMMKKILAIQNQDKLVLMGGIFVCAIAYYLLYGIYIIDDIDAAWSLSYVYNYINFNIQYDKVFGGKLGMGILFGKTQAWIYGSILNIVGWKLSYAHLISIFFIWASALLWFFTLKKLGYHLKIAIAFILLFLILEAIFSAAHKTRLDALSFFLVTLSLFLAAHRAFFISGIISVIALETHIMGGLIAGIYVLAYLLTRCLNKENFSAWCLYSLGIIVGSIYYLAFHFNELSHLIPIILHSRETDQVISPNLLYDYFFKTKYLRHIPELILILISLFIFITKKLYKHEKFVPILLFLLLCSTIIIGRTNHHYALYIYPAFILLIVITAQYIRHAYLSVLLIFMLVLPQYGFVYITQHAFNFAEYSRIVKLHVPKDKLPVVGFSTHWFSFLEDRDFFSTFYTGYLMPLKNTEKFYLIDESRFRGSRFYSPYILSFLNNCKVTIIGKETYVNSDITTKEVNCTANHQSK